MSSPIHPRLVGEEPRPETHYRGARLCPYYWALERYPWQLFITLTFVDPVPPEHQRLAECYRLFRKLARRFHLHFNDLRWFARDERGATLGRQHYHIFLDGLPSRRVTTQLCRRIESDWQSRTRASAAVSAYDAMLPGIRYSMMVAADSLSSEGRESAKLGPRDCPILFSTGLKQALGFVR